MNWDKINITKQDGEAVEAQAPIIISASRSTDIPAFYSDWFMRQIMNGKIYRKNPYNGEIYCNDISPDNVDVIVFWTRNPKPMIEKGYLSQLQNLGYRFYFQYTILLSH